VAGSSTADSLFLQSGREQQQAEELIDLGYITPGLLPTGELERTAPEQSQSELPLGARGPPAQSSLL